MMKRFFNWLRELFNITDEFSPMKHVEKYSLQPTPEEEKIKEEEPYVPVYCCDCKYYDLTNGIADQNGQVQAVCLKTKNVWKDIVTKEEHINYLTCNRLRTGLSYIYFRIDNLYPCNSKGKGYEPKPIEVDVKPAPKKQPVKTKQLKKITKK